MQILCLQGLWDPEETMLGQFIYPSLPQKGEQFEVRVKHLLTPNEVAAHHRGNTVYRNIVMMMQ